MVVKTSFTMLRILKYLNVGPTQNRVHFQTLEANFFFSYRTPQWYFKHYGLRQKAFLDNNEGRGNYDILWYLKDWLLIITTAERRLIGQSLCMWLQKSRIEKLNELHLLVWVQDSVVPNKAGIVDV